jgi:phosphatidylglycerophosphatase C
MSQADSTVVAVFDLDRTLTTRDTLMPFLVSLRPGLGAVTAIRELIRPVIGRRRDEMKSVVSDAVFRGRLEAEVVQAGGDHAARIEQKWLRPDTMARLDWHRQEGHRIVIVSASYELYVAPLAERLGIDAGLGTRLEVSESRYTGRLDGPNCRGAYKPVRLLRWLDNAGLDRQAVTIWAYGDSGGDIELLGEADHAIWVAHRVGSLSRVPGGSQR